MSVASSLVLNNGYKIPQIGFGCFNAAADIVGKAVEVAIDAGYRHIDCAKFYENEEEVGQAVARAMKANNLKREEIFVTSKLWCDKHAPADVREACELSVKKIGLGYLDLYLVHLPVSFQHKKGVEFGLEKPGCVVYENIKIEDTWRAMEELVSAGLVKSIGVSNFNKSQIERILKVCRIPPAVNQIEVSLNWPNTKLIEYCHSKNILVEGYAPLGSPDANHSQSKLPLEYPSVIEIAKKYNKTPAQVLLRHAIQRGIVVLVKSIKPERVRSNLQVMDFELTESDMDKLNATGSHQRAIQFLVVEKHPEYPFHDEY